MMDDLFKELQEMGLKRDSTKLFNRNSADKDKPKINPNMAKEVVYQRKVNCPVCSTTFMTSSIRAGRVRFLDSESDLRPIYNGIDPIVYDVVACPVCGYAHLNKFFKSISEHKVKKVKEKVAKAYNGKKYDRIYSYEDGIERYKLALFNAVEGDDLDGMRAFLCLKISWLYRGLREQLKSEESSDIMRMKSLEEQEQAFSAYALEGFLIAFNNEPFPIVGLDQNTLEYLIAELYRRQGDYHEARKWLSKVIGKANAKRLNDKIKELRELLHDEFQ